MTAVILTADEIRAAHAEAEEEAVAAETALVEAEEAAQAAREVLGGMEQQLRDGGPNPGVDAFHTASVAVRHAELAAEGARNRAQAARGRVPDMGRDLAVAAAQEYATSPEYVEIREAHAEYVKALSRLGKLVDAHKTKVQRLARELVDRGVPWAQPTQAGDYGWGSEPAVWHGIWNPPAPSIGREFGKAGRVDGFTVDGVTLIADEFDEAVGRQRRNQGR